MKRAIGSIVLGLSACGYPLTQLVVRRWGVRGAAVAECVCAGLAIRDASMVASGVPGRLRRLPAALLRLELAVGVVASLAGLHPLLSARSADRPAAARDMRRRDRAPGGRRHVVRGAYHQVRDLPSPGSGSARHAGLMRARGFRLIIPARAAAVLQAGRESARRPAHWLVATCRSPATRPGERAGCGISSPWLPCRVRVDCRPGDGQHQAVPDAPSESRDDGRDDPHPVRTDADLCGRSPGGGTLAGRGRHPRLCRDEPRPAEPG